MTISVYKSGTALRLSPSSVVGQGGEATIYQISTSEVLKLYMQPNNPLYAGNADAQAGAKLRLKEIQKKLPAFPNRLPSQVIVPSHLTYDRPRGGQINGYTMPFMSDAELLLSFSDRKYRQANGVADNDVVKIFQDLHQVVAAVHNASVVIGDFNDLNVLVDSGLRSYLIDADSMQFGSFMGRTFTPRFMDPLHSEPTRLLLKRPHSINTDWYAYTVMLFQSLLFLNPYFGGVHKPKSGHQLRNDARVLHRKTVFSADVMYPKSAVPYSYLPDELQQYFTKVFEQDSRGIFPSGMLDSLRWTTCTSCGLVHARNKCPACAKPGMVRQVITIRGTVTATRIFRTTGRILYATRQNSELRYVVHEGDAYRRENDQVVLQGPLEGRLRIRIWNNHTVFGKGSGVVVLKNDGTHEQHQTETIGNLPVFDANEHHLYRIEQGRLLHDGRLRDIHIGETLSGQTLFFAGQRFGFGFYRAGALTRAFVFDAERSGINDNVQLPTISGSLIDATATFTDHLVWFMVSVQESGILRNYCYVISSKGGLVASSSADQNDGSWLGDGIRGRLALGRSLYAATDTGIVRVGMSGSDLVVESEFPDTEPFVSAETILLPGDGGLVAVSSQEIVLLQIK